MDKRRMSWGARANSSVSGLSERVDGQTSEAARRAVIVIVPTVRVLRIPTLVLLLAPLPFIAASAALGLSAGGAGGTIVTVVAALMALVSLAFGARRHRILRAVDDPEQLATELGIAVSLSDKVEETRGVLTAISGGGGVRTFSRIRGLWSGVSMTGRWIDGVGDLPRARYFVPPKIGTTVTVSLAAVWVVPMSMLLSFLSLIGAVAGAL